jgi:predicted N-formylglutamate amidohydrolase
MNRLLAPDEPPPFEVCAGSPTSPFVIVADHAGCRIPRALGDLGVSATDRLTHIAWDIGVREVSLDLAKSLGAFVAVQTYSRLVIDCNRPLHAPDSIVQRTAGVEVPGNHGISEGERTRRIEDIFRPYHSQIEVELTRRQREQQPTVLLAMHSFTPVFMGFVRPWHVGLLFNRDTRLAKVLKRLLSEESSLVIGENEPYKVSDASDYSVVNYGERLHLPHIEIEIRQDLIATPEGQKEWIERLARVLPVAVEQL